MDFRYSELVNPFEYGTEGLCDEIPLRIHNDTTKEDMGAIRCQQDWIEFAGPLNNYKGGLDAKISFMSVTLPECLPERLEILSYANELAFLYDGTRPPRNHLSNLKICRHLRKSKPAGGTATRNLK